MSKEWFADNETEAERLEASGFAVMTVEDEKRLMRRMELNRRKISAMIEAYHVAKGAKVGTVIVCPTCGKRTLKNSYQKAFCRNRGSGNCKDRYWNMTVDTRRERAIAMS